MGDGSASCSAETTRQVVEAAYRAFGARDIEALLGLLSPDVTWGEPDNPHIPSAGTRHGLAGVIEWLQVGNQTDAILALEPQRILVDGDTAAVIGYTKVVARPTGRSYETDFAHLVTVRDGKVVRFQEFFDTWVAAEAFRAE
jgi:ketosteroid isomerase-like protein